jgi:formylglycine-generating enzyme required for sulfatase activity
MFVDQTGYRTRAEQANRSWKLDRPQPISVAGACWRLPGGTRGARPLNPEHPVVHVSASDAREYASWAGKRLPTEMEWEWAAGAGPRAVYPWDGGPSESRACYGRAFDEGPAPVVSYPPNGYGLFDMGGNVEEWCLGVDAAGSGGGSRGSGAGMDGPWVAKGGAFDHEVEGLAIRARREASRDDTIGDRGFRCAASLR